MDLIPNDHYRLGANGTGGHDDGSAPATAHYSEGTVCSSGATIELVDLPWWHLLIVPNHTEQIFFATTTTSLVGIGV